MINEIIANHNLWSHHNIIVFSYNLLTEMKDDPFRRMINGAHGNP
jgi:hypothetical protein